MLRASVIQQSTTPLANVPIVGINICCLANYVVVQCDKVAVVKDGAVVYFGPYDAAALATHMPVDHMLSDATVEAKDSAAAPAATDKVGRNPA